VKDLTQGSVYKQIIGQAVPMTIGMLVQTLYILVDLYFVAGLGTDALAAVISSANLMFLVMALTQVLSVGLVALMAPAVGAKKPAEANLLFHQGVWLGLAGTLGLFLFGPLLVQPYLHSVASSEAVMQLSHDYLIWFLPGLALQFVSVAFVAGLRATGNVQSTMKIQLLTVFLNILLAPILINGWLTGYAMGVAGAGLASTLSVIVGLVLLFFYVTRQELYLHLRQMKKPDFGIWRRILAIGSPSGAEFLMMFLFSALVYSLIKDFGSAAQAGFGAGMRLVQAISLPGVAIAFSLPAVFGQNLGAGRSDRVIASFYAALKMQLVVMGVLFFICQFNPAWLISFFSTDAEVRAAGSDFIQIISWNFFASGVVMTCSGLFQGLGNTLPGLASSATRLLLFALPAIWLSHTPAFSLHNLWLLSVCTVIAQAVLSFVLARRQLAKTQRSAEPAELNESLSS
jgi:putative MATE family efflux protein